VTARLGARLRPILAALALACSGAAAGQAGDPGPVTPAELESALPSVRAELPMRIDEITQVVGIRAEGTEFVYDVAISEAVPTDMIEEVRRDFQAQSQAMLCENADVANFLRRGGTMRHRYSDTTGFRFETRVTRCP
jgi:hypothetical protein